MLQKMWRMLCAAKIIHLRLTDGTFVGADKNIPANISNMSRCARHTVIKLTDRITGDTILMSHVDIHS